MGTITARNPIRILDDIHKDYIDDGIQKNLDGDVDQKCDNGI